MAGLLATCEDSFFLWCHAQYFVEGNNLNGFYSGMFISEVGEAYCYEILEVSQEMVDESNNCFVKVMSRNIHLDGESIYHKLKRSEYKKLSKTNSVADYNYRRLYSSVIEECRTYKSRLSFLSEFYT